MKVLVVFSGGGGEDLGNILSVLSEVAVYLVKVEDEIQLTDISKEGIEDLDKEVNGLQVCKLVIVGIDTQTKEETGVTTVHNLEVAELG